MVDPITTLPAMAGWTAQDGRFPWLIQTWPVHGSWRAAQCFHPEPPSAYLLVGYSVPNCPPLPHLSLTESHLWTPPALLTKLLTAILVHWGGSNSQLVSLYPYTVRSNCTSNQYIWVQILLFIIFMYWSHPLQIQYIPVHAILYLVWRSSKGCVHIH